MLVGILPVGSDLSPKEISIKPNDEIRLLYEKVAEEYSVDKQNVRLSYSGNDLQEYITKTLEEMDIRKGSQIDFVNAPPGGYRIF